MQLFHIATLLLPFCVVVVANATSTQTIVVTHKAATGSALPSNATYVSPGCMAVLQDEAAQGACLSVMSSVQTEKQLESLCNAPADGATGNRCSTEQINRMLEKFEAGCMRELQNDVRAVVVSYGGWLLRPFLSQSFCLRDGNRFCTAEAMRASEVSESKGDTFTCGNCDKKTFDLARSWKPSRRPVGNLTDRFLSQLNTMAEALTESCGFRAKSSGLTSAMQSGFWTILLSTLVIAATYPC
ncbi:hypothetical protein THASP1DRAFT_32680 [Thamnocephalis sphaerospora]|uniref:Uncharacterized protein n=1 Tax=Thamnocephalis sphaerospora TaxID=78915 RepID=A0A4P9XJE9_9FUNG|nr:hypothetical protein THASP1DRAFT_32680 [Thamnocephalis sphaerospora]|eukprot:RKP05481.1 hypothetical protein THASP1DRAFT_32680 [Thamnocephalis sphaerospora]